MSKIRLIFSRSSGLFSPLVQVGTWSSFSQCGILTKENTIVESAFTLGGVVETSFTSFIERVKYYEIVELDCVDADAIIAAARSQIGKPYDWTGLIGIAVRKRDWQEDDSWFCSELIAWAFDRGSTPLFNREDIHRITPQNLYMLYHELICVGPAISIH